MTNLENARRCIERFEFYCASFQAPEGSSIKDRHILRCFQNVYDVTKQYSAFIWRAYGSMYDLISPFHLYNQHPNYGKRYEC